MTQTLVRTRRSTTVIAAATLTVVLALVTCSGAIYFTFFYDDPPMSTGRILFATAFLAINATAVAAAGGLLRGSRSAWRLEISYAVWGILFTVAKLLFWQEYEAITFGVAFLGLLGLLLASPTRRHIH